MTRSPANSLCESSAPVMGLPDWFVASFVRERLAFVATAVVASLVAAVAGAVSELADAVDVIDGAVKLDLTVAENRTVTLVDASRLVKPPICDDVRSVPSEYEML